MVVGQTAKDRLLLFINHLNIGQGKFEKSCGISNGYINNLRSSPTVKVVQKIIGAYPELSQSWLITGEGEMLKSSISQTVNGDHNTQVAGNANHVNNSSTLDKAIDEISQQRQLVEKSHELTANAQRQTDKAQEQIDRLLAIIEKMQDK